MVTSTILEEIRRVDGMREMSGIYHLISKLINPHVCFLRCHGNDENWAVQTT